MSYKINNPIEYDLEVFPGWFMAGFRLPDGQHYQYVVSDSDRSQVQPLFDFLAWARESGSTLMGFNSHGYDDLILTEFLKTSDPWACYKMSVDIIVNKVPRWKFDNHIDSVDLMQLLPGRIGLKKVGVCLGHPKLQELPIPYDKTPTPQDQIVLYGYNGNDLEITHKLRLEQKDELELRVLMSEQYGIDLRSKGRATVAELILLHEFRRLGGETSLGEKLTKKQLNTNARDLVERHPYAKVARPRWWDDLVDPQSELYRLGTEVFKNQIPIVKGSLLGKAVSNRIFIGDRFYQTGVGGLHSIDGPGCWVPNQSERLIDIDVTSYYPNLILTNGLYPRAWGPVFTEIYQGIVDTRVRAKRAGDKLTADVLKIVANGTYGKTSEEFSSLYDPNMTANVTMTGQLALLALIQMLDGTANVVSANTDGITVLVSNDNYEKMNGVVSRWERATRLEMEYTEYRGLWQKDVNNYIAIKEAGGVKQKGRFLDTWPDLTHTPNANVVATAVKDYLHSDVPIETTIKGCRDLNQFLLTQNVAGNATTQWRDVKLGKVLRFYKSDSEFAAPIIKTPGDGDKFNEGIVPNSEGCIPVEDLPEELPDDLDYQWYIDEATSLLSLITRPKRTGMNAWSQVVRAAGLRPCLVDPKAKQLSRARVTYGDTDFSSIPEGWAIGTGTGDGLMGILHNDGNVTVTRVDKRYPTKTRAKVKKDHGFELVYGARVPLPLLLAPDQVFDFDEYYTPAELKKVGR